VDEINDDARKLKRSMLLDRRASMRTLA
jgi:hypothetical protein